MRLLDETSARFVDDKGRTVNYLRISVTDRCNLRCGYCSDQSRGFIAHPDILRYEEFLKIIGLAVTMSVSKVRLTGGEPLVRRDFPVFVGDIMTRHPHLDLRTTTNGVLLNKQAPELRKAGLSALNISLDTLDPERFRKITGVDAFHDVRSGIDLSLDLGFRVKLNAVAMRDVNRVDLPGFVEMARTTPIDIRFIEFMPMAESGWTKERFWSADEILADAAEHADLIPVTKRSEDHGPARMYEIAGGKGRIGVISPLSNHFCGTCNRLRITSDGYLRTCLFADTQYGLRDILRHPRLGTEHVLKVMQLATHKKPLGCDILARKTSVQNCIGRMGSIGG